MGVTFSGKTLSIHGRDSQQPSLTEKQTAKQVGISPPNKPSMEGDDANVNHIAIFVQLMIKS